MSFNCHLAKKKNLIKIQKLLLDEHKSIKHIPQKGNQAISSSIDF
jgi:UDP-N-acetylglucosamine pyrophosphorylase